MAAGIAAGFDAPIAAMFASMEDQTSYWTKRISGAVYTLHFALYLSQSSHRSLLRHWILPSMSYSVITVIENTAR